MGCVFGTVMTVTIFGESHSAGIGTVVGGLPAGIPIDLEQVSEAMRRRAPSKSAASTARREQDAVEILSGLRRGRTTGAPLAAIIRNRDTRSEDYLRTEHLLRPGHADYTGFAKYGGFADIRGGGHFSGRITAPLVFAGAVSRQALSLSGITVGAHVRRIAEVEDDAFTLFTAEELLAPEEHDVPVLCEAAGERMMSRVFEVKKQEDSLGGVIECAIVGVPAGIGEPFFDSVESVLSHILFSIPAVKAVEFGDGFALAGMRGSEANDSPRMQGKRVVFASNHSGGINGGISNGMPIVFRVAVRPTASISQPQDTINVHTMENDTLRLHGRHDACIVPRAVEVVKSAAAVALLDLLMQERARKTYAEQ